MTMTDPHLEAPAHADDAFDAASRALLRRARAMTSSRLRCAGAHRDREHTVECFLQARDDTVLDRLDAVPTAAVLFVDFVEPPA